LFNTVFLDLRFLRR